MDGCHVEVSRAQCDVKIVWGKNAGGLKLAL